MNIKKLQVSSFEKLSADELKKQLNEFKLQLNKLRMKNALRQLKETHLIKVLRKNIARVSTLLTFKTT
jgi:ribosomal protein L29